MTPSRKQLLRFDVAHAIEVSRPGRPIHVALDPRELAELLDAMDALHALTAEPITKPKRKSMAA